MSYDLLALLEACQKGDEKARDRLAPLLQNIIRGYLISRRRARDDEIDDIIQEVWERLLGGGVKNFRGNSLVQFLAYLKTITINAANSHVKRNPSHEPPKEEIPVNGDPEGGIDLTRQIARLRECTKELSLKDSAWQPNTR